MADRSRASIAPPRSYDKQEWKRIFVGWQHRANQGGIIATGTVTLVPGQNATTVTDTRATPHSFIDFMPTNGSSAIEKRRLTVSIRGDGYFIVEHTNNAIDDRTYRYCVMG